MRQDSRSEYARRMHRVLEHIDTHLAEPLDLAALAVGFNSAEAFTRAFRGRFGASPSEWRRERSKNRQTKGNDRQDDAAEFPHHDVSLQRSSEALMHTKTLGTVRLVDRAPAHVAYLRYVGPFGEPVSHFWQQQVYPWMVTNNLLGRIRYGISHDDPAIADADKLRYDACVEVPENFSGSGPYHTTTVPGGRYAAAPFKGTVLDFPGAWQELFRDWLPESGMQLDSRPFFEHYGLDSTFDPETGVMTCDLCLPVTSL